MMNIVKIAALHLFILAVQAFYMYISSRTQMKRHRTLYIAAIPVVACVPVLMSRLSPSAHSLYEYSLVFCMIFAAVADSAIASFYGRDTMTDHSWLRYLCAYLLICAASFIAAKSGFAAVAAGAIAALLAAASAGYGFVTKKLSARDILRAAVLAAAALVCSWEFTDWIL